MSVNNGVLHELVSKRLDRLIVLPISKCLPCHHSHSTSLSLSSDFLYPINYHLVLPLHFVFTWKLSPSRPVNEFNIGPSPCMLSSSQLGSETPAVRAFQTLLRNGREFLHSYSSKIQHHECHFFFFFSLNVAAAKPLQ
ncbi:hypothetical protein VIGAN_04015700 [Vigna angularis var. angularis]|uniref:Uncharacterized protein n=1 Tax=Vigna angularis var. angularis TaxID=157739 RepID=A0A0S3RR83_PHAAN|nr:hypothetical protein VIGAN_04015700 [Vigna angularis var. angularis]